jgi:hypothetical protein
MKIVGTFIVISIAAVVAFSFQNCGNIRLSSVGSSDSIQCLLPDDITGYSIALYGQTSTSDNFEVVDSHGEATQTSAEWFVNNVSQGNHIIFEDLFNGVTGCTPVTITAKFSMCSEQYILTQNISFGPNCQPVIIQDPPPPPPATCPAGQITRSSVSYFPTGTGIRNNVDVTQFDNIWGHSTGTDTIVSWPGRSDAYPSILAFNKTGYIAAKFTVPTNVNTILYGWLTHAEYNYSTDVTVSISTSCGDFHPADPACSATTTSGQNLVPWRLPTSANHSFCLLTPGTTYYLNIKAANPATPWIGCPANQATCALGTVNNYLH